jgi:hypothetical protein
MTEILSKDIFGKIIADAGYLGSKVNHEEVTIITAVRKNMKKLMTKDQHKLLKKRQLVEKVFSVIMASI